VVKNQNDKSKGKKFSNSSYVIARHNSAEAISWWGMGIATPRQVGARNDIRFLSLRGWRSQPKQPQRLPRRPDSSGLLAMTMGDEAK